jgi:hypothetical protein
MIKQNETKQQVLKSEETVSDRFERGDETLIGFFDEDECARFQAQMAERIGAGENLSENEHMMTCERCRALLGELQVIVDTIRESFKVEEEPRDELWHKIQLAIAQGEA